MSRETINTNKMKNNKIKNSAVLLVISLAGYFLVVSDGSIRTVEFVSIIGIGALAGVLLNQFLINLKNKKAV